MERYVCPEMLYKYTSLGGLIKTLEKRSLKLSRPSDFNDPIDMYIQEPLSLETKNFLVQIKHSIMDFLKGSNDALLLNSTKDAYKMGAVRSALARLSTEERADFERYAELHFINRPIEDLYDLEDLERSNRKFSAFLNETMSQFAVFCSTADHNNLLMWAHYSDQHRGAVIEYTPSIEKASALLASKPVTYSVKRPFLFQSAEEVLMIYLGEFPKKWTLKMEHGIFYSKSIEWAYEKEYRLVIPNFIKRHEKFVLLPFYEEELSAIYFGCRMSPEDKQMAARLAISVNKNVKLYTALVHPREYNLDFIPFSLA
jgi:hypothetical protein